LKQWSFRHFLMQMCLNSLNCNACVEPVTTGVTNIFKVIWLIFCAFLKKLVLILNQVSSEYRDVSRQLAKEKKQMKLERQASDI